MTSCVPRVLNPNPEPPPCTYNLHPPSISAPSPCPPLSPQPTPPIHICTLNLPPYTHNLHPSSISASSTCSPLHPQPTPPVHICTLNLPPPAPTTYTPRPYLHPQPSPPCTHNQHPPSKYTTAPSAPDPQPRQPFDPVPYTPTPGQPPHDGLLHARLVGAGAQHHAAVQVALTARRAGAGWVGGGMGMKQAGDSEGTVGSWSGGCNREEYVPRMADPHLLCGWLTHTCYSLLCGVQAHTCYSHRSCYSLLGGVQTRTCWHWPGRLGQGGSAAP